MTRIRPNKEERISLRLEPGTRDRLIRRGEKEGRSLGNLIRRMIMESLRKEKEAENEVGTEGNQEIAKIIGADRETSRLIESAPNLLEASKRARWLLDGQSADLDSYEVWKELDKAIRKAEGGQ